MSARVLVVDDTLANRRLMQAKLEAKYYSVLLAENGERALQIAQSQAPHIILLDVMMPGMDGYEVCERLKSDELTRHIPVVMLTALNDVEDRIRGLEAGADDFLSKPVDDFALMARLDALTRVNTVTQELLKREATSRQGEGFTEAERREIDRPANILVIDSHERAARHLVSPLQSAGHNVSTWQDLRQGLGAALQRIDIIILSLSRQSYDPLRLCAQLQTMDVPHDLSILVTFEAEDRDRATRALGLGAGDMIQTPANNEELLARVKTQLKRARFIKILRQRVDRGLELSVIDQLTGLYNRRYMLAQVQQWLQRCAKGGQPVSVVSFDIDHFKAVNDQFGHEAGDNVLREFAERLRANVRPKDIVCRPGGEEFLVIMPETPGQLACVGAERIRHAIAERPFDVARAGVALDVTVSAGVATATTPGDSVEELLHRADQALYRAKQLGRNRTESLAA